MGNPFVDFNAVKASEAQQVHVSSLFLVFSCGLVVVVAVLVLVVCDCCLSARTVRSL